MLWSDIYRAAYQELGVVAGNEVPGDAENTLANDKARRLLDRWNADRRAVYAQQFVNYTLTPALAPHTIGPTGTFVVTQRPVSIDGADLILNTTTPNVYTPIILRDKDWWQAQPVPDLSTAIPTDLYYETAWPNGKLFFWPVPSTAYGVRLQTRVLLATVTAATTFTLPPGYEDAIVWSLAEDLGASMGTIALARMPYVMQMAKRSRALIFANNDEPVRVASQDFGMPSGGGGTRGDFNFRTGQVTR